MVRVRKPEPAGILMAKVLHPDFQPQINTDKHRLKTKSNIKMQKPVPDRLRNQNLFLTGSGMTRPTFVGAPNSKIFFTLYF